MISLAQILALEPGADQAIARSIVAPLNAAMPHGGITTHLRVAHFVAQIDWESMHFHRLVENLNYSAERIGQVWPRLAPRAQELAHNPEKLANAAYGGRLGNGPEASGDGWKFAGKGLIQLTGRDNYRRYGMESTPDLVAQPEGAAMTAVAFWNAAGCNAWADADNVAGVTKAINGPAMDGLEARAAITARAKVVFT